MAIIRLFVKFIYGCVCVCVCVCVLVHTCVFFLACEQAPGGEVGKKTFGERDSASEASGTRVGL